METGLVVVVVVVLVVEGPAEFELAFPTFAITAPNAVATRGDCGGVPDPTIILNKKYIITNNRNALNFTVNQKQNQVVLSLLLCFEIPAIRLLKAAIIISHFTHNKIIK